MRGSIGSQGPKPGDGNRETPIRLRDPGLPGGSMTMLARRAQDWPNTRASFDALVERVRASRVSFEEEELLRDTHWCLGYHPGSSIGQEGGDGR